MSWPLRIATLSKGGADALHGVQVQAARSPGRTFFRNGLRRSTALTDVATFTRASTGYAEDASGNLVLFGSGVPRITNKGVLIEEGRTNLLLQSQTFDNAIWNKGSATINADVAVAPDGASTADKLVENASTAQHLVLQSISVGASTYTYSVFVKAAERSWVFLQQDGIPTGQYFNVSTGSLGSATGTPSAASIVPYGNGWYRCIMTFTASAGTPAVYIMLASGNNASNYTGDGTSGLYLWGAQLEAGSSATSYIPTTSTSATRNADVISEAVNIPVGQDFTVTATFVMPTNDATYPNVWFLAGESTNINRIILYASAGGVGLSLNYRAGGVGSDGTTPISAALGKPVKAVLTYSNGVIRWSANGSAVQTVNPGAFSGAFTRLFIGNNSSGNQQLNSTILDLSITMRAYSDAELRASSDITLTHDIDFVSQVYQYVGAPYVTPTDLPGTTFSRASAATGVTSAGLVVSFASGALRITDAGCAFEGASTNLALESQTFHAATWPKGGATISQDIIAAPDGTMTADKLVESATTGQHRILQNVTHAAGAYTYSIYAKAGERSWLFLQQDGIPTGQYFDLSSGALGNSTGTAPVAGIVPVGGGWYRCWMTYTAAASTPAIYVMAASANGVSNYTGDGTAGLYIWGAQLEAGSYVSAYIPTTSASATRNADVLASANDPNPTAYTVVAEFTVPLTGPDYGHVWGYDDGTAGTRAFLFFDRAGGKLWLEVKVGGVSQASLDLGAATPGQSYKVAVRIAANDFAGSKGGAAVVTDTSGTVPTTSTFRYGGSVSGSEMYGGYVQRIRRYSVGKTNSELQALAA